MTESMSKIIAKPNPAATSLPCLASLGHLTADKRFRFATPKLSSVTSFIPNTLGEIAKYLSSNVRKNIP